MRRFLVDEPLSGEEVVISGDLFRHIASVLRTAEGEGLILADGEGHEVRGRVSRIGSGTLTVRVVERLPGRDRPTPEFILLQGVAKGEKMDLVLQKCTEIGMDGIVPFVSSRCVARPDPGKSGEKIRRWTRIVHEAARQSNAPLVPRVSDIVSYREALRTEADLKLLLWEQERSLSLREALQGKGVPQKVAILVGPEGGISPQEAAEAREAGFLPVSLGERILRTETAGLVVLSIMKYHWGHLG